MMLSNYITGHWITGEGEEQQLVNAFNGNYITSISTRGLDFKSTLEYGRKKGNPALRKMTFQQRGNML